MRITDDEIQPMMIIKKNKKEVAAFRVIPYKNNMRDVIYIGKKCSLRFEAAILTSRAYKLSIERLIKVLPITPSKIDEKELTRSLNKALKKYNEMCKYEQPREIVSINDLHKELKRINRKIEICKFNNEDYSQLQIRRDDIVDELGFATDIKRYNHKQFNGYRVAPSKGYIKIYGIN